MLMFWVFFMTGINVFYRGNLSWDKMSLSYEVSISIKGTFMKLARECSSCQDTSTREKCRKLCSIICHEK